MHWNMTLEHGELHVAETIAIPVGPDEKNDGRRCLFVNLRVRVVDIEMLDITERWGGAMIPCDYIVNSRNTGDSSRLHGHEICRMRYRTRGEWVEKLAGAGD